jgi:hypothetical protein
MQGGLPPPCVTHLNANSWSMVCVGGGCAALLLLLLLLLSLLLLLLLLLSLLLLLLLMMVLRRRRAGTDVAIALARHGPSSSAPCSTMRWPVVRRLF